MRRAVWLTGFLFSSVRVGCILAVLIGVSVFAPMVFGDEAPRYVSVTFLTDPPDAEIWLEPTGQPEEFLGRSGQTLSLNLSRFSHQSGFDITCRLAGYHNLPARIGSQYFSTHAQWPETGAMRLDPTSPLVALQSFLSRNRGVLALLTLGVLILMVGVVLPRLRRSAVILKRAVTLDSLKTATKSRDPRLLSCVGPYRIVSRLGQGGMATVYRALPEATLDEKEAVAIKFMSENLLDDPLFRHRFEREIQVGCALSHPAIVSTYDWGEDDGTLYLVMELVAGQSLRKIMNQGSMGFHVAMDYLRPILTGVAYAHHQNVVHRDLKPENILVTPAGRVKIMDFGLARLTSSTLTVSSRQLGTPGYMSPEQLNGEPGDEISDQYSLGVMVFEMLTGHRVWDSEGTLNLIVQHLASAPPPLQQFRPDLPESVNAVVQRMLSKDPKDRFPHLGAVLESLQATASQVGTTASEPPPGDDSTRVL